MRVIEVAYPFKDSTMASFKASSWALLSSFREDFTVTTGSSRVMFFMLSS